MHAICEVDSRSLGVIRERDGWEGLKGKVRLRIGGGIVVRFEVRGKRNVGQVMDLERGRVRQYVNGKADGAQAISISPGEEFKAFYFIAVAEISTVGTPRTSSGTVVRLKNSTDKDCSIRKAVLFGSRASVVQNSMSGKSTLACVLSRELHSRGKLTYVLDGDNVRHGLNSDLTFKAEDRAENIRRIGEVAKLFSDAGLICIASLISPYRKDRAACRTLLPEGDFIEVFMDVPIQVCERRDPKGLYKLARSGKIKGFTGIDDPYEPPVNCEIVLKQGQESVSPCELAEKVILYLDEKGYLHA